MNQTESILLIVFFTVIAHWFSGPIAAGYVVGSYFAFMIVATIVNLCRGGSILRPPKRKKRSAR